MYVIEKGTALKVVGCTKPGLGEITDTKVKIKSPHDYRYLGDMRLYKGRVYALFSLYDEIGTAIYDSVVAQPT